MRLAWWEGRGAWRRTWIHTLAIGLGVAALVAVHGFRTDADRSIRAEAQRLLGADARLWRRDPYPDSVQAVLDSLATTGADVSTIVSVPSMVMATTTETARLFQVMGIEGGWPFYGEPVSQPPLWPLHTEAAGVHVEPAVLIQLGATVGDTVLIGDLRLPVVATVTELPAQLGFQTAIGPRVLMHRSLLDRTGLLGFGSLVRYDAYLRLPEVEAPEDVLEPYRDLLRASGTGYTTASRRARDLVEGLQYLSRFLGVLGLAALLLGGIGVASAVHVFVRSRLTTAAVLRCLGMTRRGVLATHVLQALVMGLVGSALGAATGVMIQVALPRLMSDLLPVAITSQVSWRAVGLGVIVGLWTTLAFALGPLLPLRHVTPLRALRREFEDEAPGFDRLVAVTRVGLAMTVVLLAVLEAPDLIQGLGLAGGLGLVVAALWASASVSTRAVRRAFPRRASFPVRQGVANLFRPRNQTVPVVLALGFGVFVVGTIVEIERNLVEGLTLESGEGLPNVLLFDIQSDQRAAVERLVGEFAETAPASTPMLPSRIAALDGRPASELMADTSESAPSRWALRREYRSSYRDTLNASEALVAGAWWSERGVSRGSAVPAISMEQDLANSLGLGLGSRVTWNLGGRELETEIVNLRRVDWARFEPNFFVLFEPGVAERAPHTWVTLARVETPDGRARLQRDVAVTFTNVSVLDLARVQQTMDGMLDTARRVLRFLALFSTLAGIVVLSGAVGVTRSQRMREAALLKTLGASRSLVLRILVVEYAALGALAVVGALLLAMISSWAVVTWVFEMEFRVHFTAAAALALTVTALALAAGLAGSRGVLGRPPLQALREVAE
jgi:putative ABC transport system permease protein